MFDRIRDVDRALQPQDQQRVREVHPELCFMQLNAGEPLMHSKKKAAGRNFRCALLSRPFGAQAFDEIRSRHRAGEVADDDILDALAALHTARRVQSGHARVVPEEQALDTRGLRMEMWL